MRFSNIAGRDSPERHQLYCMPRNVWIRPTKKRAQKTLTSDYRSMRHMLLAYYCIALALVLAHILRYPWLDIRAFYNDTLSFTSSTSPCTSSTSEPTSQQLSILGRRDYVRVMGSFCVLVQSPPVPHLAIHPARDQTFHPTTYQEQMARHEPTDFLMIFELGSNSSIENNSTSVA